MKIKPITSFFKLAVVLFMLSFPCQAAFAQEGFDDNVDDETPQAFIDGFLVVGVAAGAAYGLTKLKKDN